MFSVHYGSDSGETGAGAVLLDGELVSSDVVLAVQADGHSITTVEALNTEAELTRSRLRSLQPAHFNRLFGGRNGARHFGAPREEPCTNRRQIRDMLREYLTEKPHMWKPVEAIHRAAAVLRGEETEAFAPLIVPPLTQQGEPADYDPSDPAPTASPAVPRVIPSRDVPDMAVVGKPEIKVDAIRLAKGNPAFTDDIELRNMLFAKVLRSPHAHSNHQH